MRKFCIGDIHGRFEALKEVLTKSKFDYEKDKLIILGDVVDGGYNTYEVVEELLKIKNKVYIVGNHDEWFMDHIKSGWSGNIWLSQGGMNTVRSYIKDQPADPFTVLIDPLIPVTHQEFFNNGKYWHEEDNMMFVHGGFKVQLHPREETKHNLVLDREIINVARHYDRVGKKIGKWDKIFIGHSTTQMLGGDPKIKDCMRPLKFSNLLMMDCGAGWSGKLAIMDIHTEKFWLSKQQKPARN